MGLSYSSAAAHVNQALYDILYPAYYSPLEIGKEYTQGFDDLEVGSAIYGVKSIPQKPQIFDQIYQPLYVDALSKGRLTIAHLVDMFHTKTPFTVCYDKDTVAIFHSLDNYLYEVEGAVAEGNQDVIRYVQKVLDFREVFYHKFRRVINVNQWADRYSQGEEQVKDFFDIIARFTAGPSAHIVHDPVEALRRPPYQLSTPNQSMIPSIQRQGSLNEQISQLQLPNQEEYINTSIGFKV